MSILIVILNMTTNRLLWTTFLLTLLFESRFCDIQCDVNDNCECFQTKSDMEIQCPPDFYDLIIHIQNEESILIDCYNNSTDFNINQLPNITVSTIVSFRMRFCPLPPRSFNEILDWFLIRNLSFLEFSSSNTSSTVLSADYFEASLNDLKTLKVADNGLTDFDENIFFNLPNLISLNLEGNNITLKENFFKNIPSLEFLDISGNNLKSLPAKIFEPLKNLKILHLWNNNLKTLNHLTLCGLVSLQSLELSVNKIKTISEDAFKDLRNLTHINLSTNHIKALPANLFRHNTRLKLVRMKNNLNLNLSDYLFANLSLTHVDLTNCNLRWIPPGIFENTFSLKVVKLETNNLKSLPEDLFKGLVNLEQVRLQNNKLESIRGLFAGLTRLKSLRLQNNLIFSLDREVFQDLSSLEEINLKDNKISEVHPHVFYHTSNLRIINLSNNEYRGGFNLIDHTPNVEKVDLSYNRVERLEDVISFSGAKSLSKVDLSHNYITRVKVRDLTSVAEVLIKLDYNNVTIVDFENFELSRDGLGQSKISLSHNLIECDCYNYDLVKYLRDASKGRKVEISSKDLHCAGPPEKKNVSISKVVPSLLTCPITSLTVKNTKCPDKCCCTWRPSDKAVIVNCSNSNFKTFPEFFLNQSESFRFNQTEMHLEHNDLVEGPSSNLTGYHNITKLFLSHNRIRTITWLPPRVEVLHLDHNQISDLSHVVTDLNSTNLVNLTLNHNPWTCDCGSENLAVLLRRHEDAKNVFCANTTIRLVDLKRSDLCQTWNLAHFALITVAVLLTIAISLALFYRNQQSLKVWLYSRSMCLWWVSEDELDQNKTYDAFISYSQRDEEFVVKHLLPQLESPPQPYKLCLHYRNWIPGESIPAQITNSVLQSRRTLVVLSQNFLDSVWGLMEFRTAHTQAMSDGRARVVLVLLEDLDLRSLDEELKIYLKTNTYVKWGDPYFWDKLKYALPHYKKRVSGKGKKLENIKRVTDDRSFLVQSAPSSPGSTPPVSLSSSFSKINPLNFSQKVPEGRTLLSHPE